MMYDTVISCSCCGRPAVIPAECTLLECPACGTRNARPRSTGTALEILRRAVDQRLACDFHNAEKSYQHVLLEHPDEHEALWGCLLCRYGVEYVEDPVSKRRMPTVHTIRPKPLQEQADYHRACDFAPPEVRAQYELDAAYIDDAQASILQLAQSCQPYDVFLCHKTTKPGSMEKTEDFHRAASLYHFLKDQGVRAFFAPESLQSAAGANYEAGIYHALQTAKVMLVICSDASYLTSAWVRSEWSRFLEMTESAPDKRLIPLLYDHFSASDLPKEFIFRRLQGLDMTEITAPQTLMNLLEKAIIHERTPAVEPKQPEPKQPEPKQPEPKQPEQARPNPEPATPPKTEPTKPVVAPPAPSQHYVTLTFPGLRDHWKTVPEWKIYGSDKKTELADVKWGSTMQVSISSERTQLWFGTPQTNKSRYIFGAIGAILLIITLVLVSRAQEVHYTDAAIYWFTAVYIGLFALVFICQVLRTANYSGSIIVTSRKRYRLTWPWAKTNTNFKVEEY